MSASWNYSNFLLTVNTQRQAFDVDRLKSVMRRIFEDDGMFYALLKGQGIDTVDRDFANVELTVERGPKSGLIHAHAVIVLRHRGRIHLNTALVSEVLQKALGLDGLYVDVRACGDPAKNMQRYLAKNPL